MKKVLLISGAVIILLVIGFFALNSYIYNQKQGNDYFQLSGISQGVGNVSQRKGIFL